ADQLGRSVGEMYRGAFIPAFMLIGMYVLYVGAMAVFAPKQVPALPPEARKFNQDDGRSGHTSLAILMGVLAAAGIAFAQIYGTLLSATSGREVTPATDETVVASLTAVALVGLLLALANRKLGLGLLSK